MHLMKRPHLPWLVPRWLQCLQQRSWAKKGFFLQWAWDPFLGIRREHMPWFSSAAAASNPKAAKRTAGWPSSVWTSCWIRIKSGRENIGIVSGVRHRKHMHKGRRCRKTCWGHLCVPKPRPPIPLSGDEGQKRRRQKPQPRYFLLFYSKKEIKI